MDLPGTVPDKGLSYSKVASCTGPDPDLSAAAAADVPTAGSCPAASGNTGCVGLSNPAPCCTGMNTGTCPTTPSFGLRHCTSPGCLFGAPLAVPNPANTATGTCVVNFIDSRTINGALPGSGRITCATGDISNSTPLALPLNSQLYLTGSINPVNTCSSCVNGTFGVCGSGTCSGGSRNGLPCTPETSALSGSYPTSHDCPPPGSPSGALASGCSPVSGTTFIGCLPVDFTLSTGTQTKTAFSTGAQARVFCGFCFDPTASNAFANPPDPCTSDAHCAARGDLFDSCRQQSNGAFRNPFATTYTETGTSPNACIADGAAHNATLVSSFCIPPSYNGIVDPAGELPGPGAVSLPGVSQFIP